MPRDEQIRNLYPIGIQHYTKLGAGITLADIDCIALVGSSYYIGWEPFLHWLESTGWELELFSCIGWEHWLGASSYCILHLMAGSSYCIGCWVNPLSAIGAMWCGVGGTRIIAFEFIFKHWN